MPRPRKKPPSDESERITIAEYTHQAPPEETYIKQRKAMVKRASAAIGEAMIRVAEEQGEMTALEWLHALEPWQTHLIALGLKYGDWSDLVARAQDKHK